MSNTGDLTTTKAPFIEKAQQNGELYIEQPYELYSEINHKTWKTLYSRLVPKWEQYAHPRFLEGVANVALDSERVPKLSDINNFLSPLSGFSAKAVSGYVPSYLFFDCLRQRAFPTTITIRDHSSLGYLPEPDIFHDAAGHVPMHTDRVFADTLVRFGEVAKSAAKIVQSISDKDEAYRVLRSILRGMSRFFWFSIEFGLMRSGSETKVYGSGILSSFEEIQHAIESPEVQRVPFQLEWVLNQQFEIDSFQPLLFTIDSFDQLFEQVENLEKWITEGKLNNLSAGQPSVNEEDLKSFLNASI